MRLPRFQIHLSTLIVLQLVAAGLVWINMKPMLNPYVVGLVQYPYFGWPLPYFYEDSPILEHMEYTRMIHQPEEISILCLVGDFFVALAILLAVAVLLEWPIRRAARKKAQAESQNKP